MTKEVLCEQKERAMYIIINREKRRNALSLSVLDAITGHFYEALKSDDIICVCITGSGDKIFSAGADLTMGKNGKLQDLEKATEKYSSLLKLMAVYEKPIIARVNGSCMGGGLGIMLSCDIVIARDDAVFWTPEPEIGLFPMMIGPLLHQHIGDKILMDMILTGRKISSHEAVRLGLITKAVSPSELDSSVQRAIKAIEARSLTAIRHGKRAFARIKGMDFESAMDYLRDAFMELVSTDDAKEGIRAFFEKRGLKR